MAFERASEQPEKVEMSDTVQIVEKKSAVSQSEEYRDVEKGRSVAANHASVADPRALTR